MNGHEKESLIERFYDYLPLLDEKNLSTHQRNELENYFLSTISSLCCGQTKCIMEEKIDINVVCNILLQYGKYEDTNKNYPISIYCFTLIIEEYEQRDKISDAEKNQKKDLSSNIILSQIVKEAYLFLSQTFLLLRCNDHPLLYVSNKVNGAIYNCALNDSYKRSHKEEVFSTLYAEVREKINTHMAKLRDSTILIEQYLWRCIDIGQTLSDQSLEISCIAQHNLALLYLQRKDKENVAKELLRGLGYKYSINPILFKFPKTFCTSKELSRSEIPIDNLTSLLKNDNTIGYVDKVLPGPIFSLLRNVFTNVEHPYWKEHNYDHPTTGYFSYLNSVCKSTLKNIQSKTFKACKYRNIIDQVIAITLAHLAKKYDKDIINQIEFCEWWVHNRNISSGHMIHLDSDENGLYTSYNNFDYAEEDICQSKRKKASQKSNQTVTRHPLISTVLYLSEEDKLEGKDLVTKDEKTTNRKNSEKDDGVKMGPTFVVSGPLSDNDEVHDSSCVSYVYPQANRLLYFDGDLIHGVLPGVCNTKKRMKTNLDNHKEKRRVTFMMGFWTKDISINPSGCGKRESCSHNNSPKEKEMVIGPCMPYPYSYGVSEKEIQRDDEKYFTPLRDKGLGKNFVTWPRYFLGSISFSNIEFLLREASHFDLYHVSPAFVSLEYSESALHDALTERIVRHAPHSSLSRYFTTSKTLIHDDLTKVVYKKQKINLQDRIALNQILSDFQKKKIFTEHLDLPNPVDLKENVTDVLREAKYTEENILKFTEDILDQMNSNHDPSIITDDIVSSLVCSFASLSHIYFYLSQLLTDSSPKHKEKAERTSIERKTETISLKSVEHINNKRKRNSLKEEMQTFTNDKIREEVNESDSERSKRRKLKKSKGSIIEQRISTLKMKEHKKYKQLIGTYQNQLCGIIDFLSQICNNGFSRSIVGKLSIETMLCFYSRIHNQILMDFAAMKHLKYDFSEIIEGRLLLLRTVLDLYCNLATRHTANQRRLLYGLFQYAKTVKSVDSPADLQTLDINEINLDTFLTLFMKFFNELGILSNIQTHNRTALNKNHITEEQEMVMSLFWNLFPSLTVNRNLSDKSISKEREESINNTSKSAHQTEGITTQNVYLQFLDTLYKIKANYDTHSNALEAMNANSSKIGYAFTAAIGCLASLLSCPLICTSKVTDERNDGVFIQNLLHSMISDENINYFSKQLLKEIESLYYDDDQTITDSVPNSTMSTDTEDIDVDIEENTDMTEVEDQMSDGCSHSSHFGFLQVGNQKKLHQQNKFDDIIECMYAIQILLKFSRKGIENSSDTKINELLQLMPPQLHSVFYLLLGEEEDVSINSQDI